MDDLKDGDRVELVFTNDEYTKLKPGDLGTFRRYGPGSDRILWIDWDDGSNLMIIPDAGDVVKKVTV